jgi:hypothetical protein
MSTRTGLVPGTAVSLTDGVVRQELTRLHPEVSGCSRRVGLRNEAGVVYRWIQTLGLGHFVDVMATMVGLGYVDDWSKMNSHSGFDAILAPDANRSRAAVRDGSHGGRTRVVSARRSSRDSHAVVAPGGYRRAASLAQAGAP